ncbi:hypothetical protein KGQ20_15890 [Catenulispora sp. NF23]|uniref:Uncharacterized protein n=1 Tax=Catenulispora pinistramenti TaxID=2705254 RepID=A0ABS5KXP3_9ACTN|nr:hypothetical protein [Catenulispora pinistramenti]MBS2534252.1 hypothetical protein [Catenulispora pinistramenti]MBS2550820.1 hypothetical protein [Catenulispora pinistramenti]
MTVRTSQHGDLIVYAGRPDELAAIACEYANGRRPMPHGLSARLLANVAERLRTGSYPAFNLGPVRFYRDRADGAPFRGPYAPAPDPEWLAQQDARLGSRA